uniref:Uncharacterized protein n=1 Tax=Schistocephalus solidus TaxID=70667 RepID=A0A0X3Q4A7_SCHSO
MGEIMTNALHKSQITESNSSTLDGVKTKTRETGVAISGLLAILSQSYLMPSADHLGFEPANFGPNNSLAIVSDDMHRVLQGKGKAPVFSFCDVGTNEVRQNQLCPDEPYEKTQTWMTYIPVPRNILKDEFSSRIIQNGSLKRCPASAVLSNQLFI